MNSRPSPPSTMTRIRPETRTSVATSPDDATARARVGSIVIGTIASAVAVALVATATGWGWAGVVASLPLVPATVAAVIDVRTRVLPDLVVATAAGVATFVAVVDRGASGFVLVALGAVFAAAPLLAVHAVAPGTLGFGDVKLGAALGAMLGVSSPDPATALLLALVMVAVASATGLLTALATRRRDVPLGPALVVGATIAMMSADRLGGAPLS